MSTSSKCEYDLRGTLGYGPCWSGLLPSELLGLATRPSSSIQGPQGQSPAGNGEQVEDYLETYVEISDDYDNEEGKERSNTYEESTFDRNIEPGNVFSSTFDNNASALGYQDLL